MQRLTGVQRLRAGDTVAVLTPSWAGPSSFPHVFELGVKRLQELGLKIVEYPTTRATSEENQAHPERRARDIVTAFQDPQVRGIICSIGGNDAVRLLPYLEGENLPPKFFMGYSDSTALLHYFMVRGIIVFHGPSVMAGFAEPGEIPQEQRDHLQTFLFDSWSEYSYPHYNTYTDAPMTWENPSSLDQVRSFESSPPLSLAFPPRIDIIRGILWGGCVQTLEQIKASPYWPQDATFWKDTITCLEIADEPMSRLQLVDIFRDYVRKGVFQNASALLFGRVPKKSGLSTDILRLVYEQVQAECVGYIPAVFDMDFGHTYPQVILPLGAEATLTLSPSVTLVVESPYDSGNN